MYKTKQGTGENYCSYELATHDKDKKIKVNDPTDTDKVSSQTQDENQQQ